MDQQFYETNIFSGHFFLPIVLSAQSFIRAKFIFRLKFVLDPIFVWDYETSNEDEGKSLSEKKTLDSSLIAFYEDILQNNHEVVLFQTSMKTQIADILSTLTANKTGVT